MPVTSTGSDPCLILNFVRRAASSANGRSRRFPLCAAAEFTFPSLPIVISTLTVSSLPSQFDASAMTALGSRFARPFFAVFLSLSAPVRKPPTSSPSITNVFSEPLAPSIPNPDPRPSPSTSSGRITVVIDELRVSMMFASEVTATIAVTPDDRLIN